MTQEEQNSTTNLDVLFFIRAVFYIWLAAKIIEIILFRKKRLNIKQRIERKYLFSHGEMVKSYNP